MAGYLALGIQRDGTVHRSQRGSLARGIQQRRVEAASDRPQTQPANRRWRRPRGYSSTSPSGLAPS